MRNSGTRVSHACLTLIACLSLIAVAGACGTALSTPAGGQGMAASPTYDPNEFALTPVKPDATRWPPFTPTPQPTPNPNNGNEWNLSSTFGPPPTAEQFAHAFDLIVTGTVIQILPAQWTTPDGKRPADLTTDSVYARYAIITPAILKLDGAPLVNSQNADVTPGVLVVATFGGTVGRDLVTTNDPSQQLEMGQHILVGLSDHPYPFVEGHAHHSTPAGPTWNVGLAYTLTDDEKAIPGIPNAQPVDAQAFIAAIVKAAANQP